MSSTMVPCWVYQVNTLPTEHAHRVLDCVLHEGHKALFRTGLCAAAARCEKTSKMRNMGISWGYHGDIMGISWDSGV